MKPSDSDHAGLAKGRSLQTPMGLKHFSLSDLLPMIKPHLDKDSAMQVDIVHKKFKNNEITVKDFRRQAISIVGDQMINVTLYKLQTQAFKSSMKAVNQFKSETQVSSNEGLKTLTYQARDSIENSRYVETLSDLHGVQVHSLTSPSKHPMAAPKKHLIDKKRQVEAPCSLPRSSKKRKVPGVLRDNQLNDVIATSGLNLDDEEKQLFSGSKEATCLSEVSRRVVQEEEEMLFLQKIPLQNKVAEIMAKTGLKCVGNDVVRCLSLCVEKRLRTVIAELIRLSRKRYDMEKLMHRITVTSDIGEQILAVNRKAREEVENKQAEANKSLEPTKGNKDEYDKMLANAAIRAATGGGDIVSRWQLMNTLPTSSTRKTKESHKAEKHVHSKSPASVRKVGRDQVIVHHRLAQRITMKDVLSVLDREPQMSNSILIYRYKIGCTGSPIKD